MSVLRQLLDVDELHIENLISEASASTRVIQHLAARIDTAALAARLSLAAADADLVVCAWGARAPRGWGKRAWEELVEAADASLARAGHARVLQVGVGSYHPSRWRQHTSPVHQRYRGDTFEARLSHALRWRELSSTQIRSGPS